MLSCKGLQKLGSGRLLVISCTLHPRVSSNLLNIRAKVAVVTEELEDEVLEFATQTSAVDFLEISVVLALEQQVVEVFLLAGLLEGEDALHDNEKDDAN